MGDVSHLSNLRHDDEDQEVSLLFVTASGKKGAIARFLSRISAEPGLDFQIVQVPQPASHASPRTATKAAVAAASVAAPFPRGPDPSFGQVSRPRPLDPPGAQLTATSPFKTERGAKENEVVDQRRLFPEGLHQPKESEKDRSIEHQSQQVRNESQVYHQLGNVGVDLFHNGETQLRGQTPAVRTTPFATRALPMRKPASLPMNAPATSPNAAMLLLADEASRQSPSMPAAAADPEEKPDRDLNRLSPTAIELTRAIVPQFQPRPYQQQLQDGGKRDKRSLAGGERTSPSSTRTGNLADVSTNTDTDMMHSASTLLLAAGSSAMPPHNFFQIHRDQDASREVLPSEPHLAFATAGSSSTLNSMTSNIRPTYHHAIASPEPGHATHYIVASHQSPVVITAEPKRKEEWREHLAMNPADTMPLESAGSNVHRIDTTVQELPRDLEGNNESAATKQRRQSAEATNKEEDLSDGTVSEDDSQSAAKKRRVSKKPFGSKVGFDGTKYTIGDTVVNLGYDVAMCGRGGFVNKVNGFLAKMIDEKFRPVYRSHARTAGKREVLHAVYDYVKSRGGRFLGDDGQEIAKAKALCKIRAAIAGHRKDKD